MYGHPTKHLAENPRTAIKARIKRASKQARSKMRTLDRDQAARLEGIYRAALDDLGEYLERRAGDDNTLRLEVMRDLLDQAEMRMNLLARERDETLGTLLREAANLGVQPFVAPDIGINITRVADEAVRFVTHFTAEDGLQLSDRLWRIDQHGRDVVSQAIQSHIIQGHSASQAAQDFLLRGERMPAHLRDKIGKANPQAIKRVMGRDLMTGEGSAYANALRLFRTEINRAHGEAYQAAAFEDESVIGTRFLLSPNHPRTDICDMHARVNRFGLGPGVYPKGKNPWPAHPNTLSFVEVVFDDEVSKDDKQGKENRIAWLKRQDPATQASVLGARAKQAALRQGVLRENAITTPWRVLKKRYERQGIDITGAIPHGGGTREAVAEDVGVIIKTSVPADFPTGDTLRRASAITRKQVNGARAHDYIKNDDGQYLVRFRHGRRYQPDKVREKTYNKASLSGMDVELVNATNRMLHEVNQVGDRVGIPHLRNVNSSAGGALARMGDGSLSLSKDNNRNFRGRMTQAEAITHYERQISNRMATVEQIKDHFPESTRSSGIKRQIETQEKDIALLNQRLQKLRDGVPVHVVVNPPNEWKPGSSLPKPFTTDAYFSLPEDKFRTTVWHEYGHHIHQQLGVTSAREYVDPPLEKHLAGLFKKKVGAGGKGGDAFPTRYSTTNHKEWFAESYSLYRLGRSDLVDTDMLALIHKIERGEWTQ